MSFKGIKFKDDEFFKVGCRHCDNFNQKWELAVNLSFSKYIMICCNCKQITELDKNNIVNEPDKKVYDARFF